MRDYLIAQLKDLIKHDQVDRKHAQEVLEIYDEEIEDEHGEGSAFEKAQQDIEILLKGEWGE